MDEMPEELIQGYAECSCGNGVRLLQAGFECETKLCMDCGEYVADRSEFYKFETGVEHLSK